MDILKKMSFILSRRSKLKFILLLGLVIPSGILEALGLGILVPIVGMINDPSIIQKKPYFHYLYTTFGFQSNRGFIMFSICFLMIFYMIKNVFLYLTALLQNTMVFREQVNISKKLFKIYMFEPYHISIQTNSSILIKNTTNEVKKVFGQMLNAMFLIATDVFIIICLLTLMVIVSPWITLTISVFFGLYIFLFFKVFRNRIRQSAEILKSSQSELTKWVKQGLGGMKEVKLTGREHYFIGMYQKYAIKFADSSKFNSMVLKIPRFTIETIMVTIFALTMLVILWNNVDLTSLVTIVSIFVVATIRLMPAISRLMNSQTIVKQCIPSLEMVYEAFVQGNQQQNNPDYTSSASQHLPVSSSLRREFTTSIDVNNISYRYPSSERLVVNNVSLSIPIGKSVAIIGPSGSGKTTLMDLILGLLEPAEGSILVDGHKLQSIQHLWKENVGYIPQFIFLTDDTVRRNIAFGIEDSKINDEQVWKALEQAQLKSYVESLPNQLGSSMGEAGNKMSGGQRQRIGIARALYRNPEILFLDEATSSLDQDTEKEVMNAIHGLHGQKTVVIITHRLSSIAQCDIIYEMKEGKLVSVKKANE